MIALKTAFFCVLLSIFPRTLANPGFDSHARFHPPLQAATTDKALETRRHRGKKAYFVIIPFLKRVLALGRYLHAHLDLSPPHTLFEKG